jgi:hypothetical protein
MLFNFDEYVALMSESGRWNVILSGATSPSTFDYISFGDAVYFGNGEEEDKATDDGTESRKMGITAPVSAPTVALGVAGALTGDYLYKFAYVNSSTGHISNGSPVSASITTTSDKVDLSDIAASADPQVDKINIYRTTDGGATFLYLTQIDNGTTTYTDNAADSTLGTTQAPTANYPPTREHVGFEEWDGRIFCFAKNSTFLDFSNDETQTVSGEGLPEESFDTFNYIDFRAKIYGVRKSPDYNELMVHTSKGIYSVVKTGVSEAPYTYVIRNSQWYAVSHKSIVNIYNEQWFMGGQGRLMSINGAGAANYESYLIEPTMSDDGNILAYPDVQAAHYIPGDKNQYRIIVPESGQSSPNRMFAANYRQLTPVTQEGWTFPVWELHNIAATALGTFINSSGDMLLVTGTSAGKLIQQDTGTDDDGEAIDWSITIGWTRVTESAFRHHLATHLLGYYLPLGTYSIPVTTSFDFGNVQGDVYSIDMTSEGSLWDVALWDVGVWDAGGNLKLWSVPIYGDFKTMSVMFSGSSLAQSFEQHSMSVLFVPIEGLRDAV